MAKGLCRWEKIKDLWGGGINPFLKDPDLIQPPNLRGRLLYPSEVKYWS